MIAVVRGAVLAAGLLSAGTASAQTVPFQLVPDERPHIEIAAQAGWDGVSRAEFRASSERYDVGTAGVSLGYFWTRHAKTELTLARAGRGFLYRTELVEGGSHVPSYRSSEHTFEATLLSPALTYQFLTNRWVHPFVTAGAYVVRERHEVFTHETGARTSSLDVTATPFVGAGAKFFVSPRVFIRSDVRTTVADDGLRRSSWTAGAGVEF
jgi:opacity protein-like surface antigen